MIVNLNEERIFSAIKDGAVNDVAVKMLSLKLIFQTHLQEIKNSLS